MRRALQTFVLTSFLGLALAACAGYSPEEAQTKCDLERAAKAACVNDAAYQQCLSCFEECGDSCAIAESCPIQYICSE
ncbi:hypothetical protein [Polyangium sp. 15x6]|uniref:hypothetical protein n=1 Tax=Polyangium sp. 15x6 TaxID=3042687 RepID=UPI002499E175|nr:hypothetical protein [Polyangium sp. 15x6]MDI3286416.1 hypothetical protein [Polyangium sp. 15x6]